MIPSDGVAVCLKAPLPSHLTLSRYCDSLQRTTAASMARLSASSPSASERYACREICIHHDVSSSPSTWELVTFPSTFRKLFSEDQRGTVTYARPYSKDARISTDIDLPFPYLGHYPSGTQPRLTLSRNEC